MAELAGTSILGLDRIVYSYRPRDPIALAHAPEVFFRRPGRQRRACISSPCPQGFEPARRSTAPCRWRRAIEWRLASSGSCSSAPERSDDVGGTTKRAVLRRGAAFRSKSHHEMASRLSAGLVAVGIQKR